MSDDTAAPAQCPFTVGQIIKTVVGRIYLTDESGAQVSWPSNQPPEVATVRAVRDEPPEFDYDYPCTVHRNPRLGHSFTGGTCFALGFNGWEPATKAELDAFARSWDLSLTTSFSFNWTLPNPPTPCSST